MAPRFDRLMAPRFDRMLHELLRGHPKHATELLPLIAALLGKRLVVG
jgi:hypothetical protein